MMMTATLQDLRTRNRTRAARIVETAAPLDVDDLPWSEVGDHPLDEGALDVLVYMRDVEGFTDRDPVGLSAHRTTLSDPLVRRFLSIWRTDEAGHTRAIERFLDRYGAARSIRFPRRQPPPPSVAARHERVVGRLGGPVGELVAAAHMTWGAANELLTVHGYRRLADRCGHPLLATLLGRIATQEARHFSFYVLEAEWRLAASRAARTLLGQMLRRAWTPVGVGDGYKSMTEFGRVLGYLGSGHEGRRTIERMDHRFSALPGFERLRIFGDAWNALAGPRAAD